MSQSEVTPGLTGLAQVYNPTDDPYTKLCYDGEVGQTGGEE